jgi:DNA-directed RNA polymerase subunit alpha
VKAIAECGIDLFADVLPALEQIAKLSRFVNSSERNRIVFGEQLEKNLDQTGQKAALAVGIGLVIVGRNAEAVERLKKAGDCREKFIYLAFALRSLGRFEQVIENLQNSLDYEADPLGVTLEKAATYCCAGDFEAAARQLKSCSNYENVSAEYHYQLGRLVEAQGQYLQAMENYKTAIELKPEHQEALFHLAYRCDMAGDEDAAIDYYRQLAIGAPAHVNALLNLAVLYEDRGEFNKAEQWVDKVLKHHPNHQRAILFKKDIECSETMFYDEEKERKKDRRTQILETPISDFELSVRSRNCFKKMNIDTLGDLMNITESELLSYKNFGETSLREIKVILESKALRLGMALEEKQDEEGEEDDSNEYDETKEMMKKTVDDINLSVRSRRCLQKLDIHTIGELVLKTEAELLGCKNFGVTSLNEIKKALVNVGLSLRTLD